MTRRRIKLPSIGGFNSGRGSIQALHPKPHLPNESYAQYQLLTDWAKDNFFSIKQCRRLIRTNVLLSIKHKGRIWVRFNSRCEDLLVDL